MRFAITLTDRYLGIFDAFLNAGWEPVKLFTAPVDNRMYHNKASVERAQKLGIPIQLSRMSDEDLADMQRQRVDALIVASYQWKIGDWERYVPFAVNFHPSPLPVGRGPYPLIRAITDGFTEWGVTCHKLSEEFDKGDIIAQDRFALAPDECHESLDLKIQFASRRLAERVANNFEPLWHVATPQTEGSYWKLFTEAERTLDFNRPLADLLRQIRAFGEHECYATINDTKVYVRRAIGWQESHRFKPGHLVLSSTMRLVVAAADGLIGLLEWSVVAPDVPMGKIGR
jgi:methionyl-tRNA formyltransferase